MAKIPDDAASENDNDAGFYTAPRGTGDPKALGYSDPAREIDRPAADTPHFLIRMTPGPVNLAKGVPVDFTIHVKPLGDFTSQHPLVLTLDPVIGKGSGYFPQPASSLPGNPGVSLNDGKISITAVSGDNAAKVILRTDYPPDWWAGESRCVIQACETLSPAGEPSRVLVSSVEANVFVSDRTPASWQRFVGVQDKADK